MDIPMKKKEKSDWENGFPIKGKMFRKKASKDNY